MNLKLKIWMLPILELMFRLWDPQLRVVIFSLIYGMLLHLIGMIGKNLKYEVVLNGLRNSLLVAPMPTASTSQIMGFNESFEPFTNNLFKRKDIKW